MELYDLLMQVWAFIKGLGNMSAQEQISGLVLLLVGAWKNSAVRNFLWDKLGAFKVLVAPVLGMLSAIVMLGDWSLATIWMGLQGGALSIALHQLLDAVKALPGIGAGYLKILDLIGLVLKKPALAKK